MFWKDSGSRSSSGSGRDQNGVGPFGQVRVLIVGDSGVGKSSLVHLILKNSAIARPAQTVGCTVGIKHVTYGSAGGSSNNISDAERNFFVELWDVSGHQWYKACRSIFYTQINGLILYFLVPMLQSAKAPLAVLDPHLVHVYIISNIFDRETSVLSSSRASYRSTINIKHQIRHFQNDPSGVIFVYDLSQRKTKTNLNKWAVEVAETGTFSAPLGSGGPGGLPVPYLVIANKVDIVPRDGTRASRGNLVDLARQWAEKQGLLRCSEELPLTESFPGNSGLVSAAKQARYDKEAVIKFFRLLIRRRYFSNEPPAPSPWSLTPREDTILPVESLGGGVDNFQRKSLSGEGFLYNGVVPLPAQRNLTPPPTLDPEQPVSSLDNYRYHRFSSSSLPDVSSDRTSLEDIIDV